MQYVVFHAIVFTEEPEAYQEYYIRHTDGCPVSSEGEKQRLVHCLEAAIKRRSTDGLRLELCCEDRIGLLSDVTRIFRENGLSVIRAEVSTRESRAMNVFYVTDASGNPVQSQTIEAVRNSIGATVLCVKDDMSSRPSPQDGGRFSLGNLFRSRSEKSSFPSLLHSVGPWSLLLLISDSLMIQRIDPVATAAHLAVCHQAIKEMGLSLHVRIS
ncbi:hypothetical protein HPP92_002799 [Vanilla planifolia]|uniref:ACT domain-containing protein ACR n=1 Tax=Vanilla planifolia TaxID=51239 RepID=A0A835SFA7_VANPL|nr:hypothetical protein HPP92_002799 [Vanilla planifolia]